LDNKVFDVTEARCKHEVHRNFFSLLIKVQVNT